MCGKSYGLWAGALVAMGALACGLDLSAVADAERVDAGSTPTPTPAPTDEERRPRSDAGTTSDASDASVEPQVPEDAGQPIDVEVPPVQCQPDSVSYRPLAVGGFNSDIVAEQPTAEANSSHAVDGSGYVLYVGRGFDAGTDGLPSNGEIIRLDDAGRYKLGAYTQNNALLLHGQLVSNSDPNTISRNGLLTLTNPERLARLSLLGFGTENGTEDSVRLPATLEIKVIHVNNTVEAYEGTLADWSVANGSVSAGIGRVSRNNDNDTQNPFYLHTLDLELSCENMTPIRSIQLRNISQGTNSRAIVFAVAGVSPVDVAQ